MIDTATRWIELEVDGGERTIKIVTELNNKPVHREINIEEKNVKPLLMLLKSVRIKAEAIKTEINHTIVTIDDNGNLIEEDGVKRDKWRLMANCTGESLHRIIMYIRELRERGEIE